MKKIFVMLFAVVLSSASMMAQDKKTPPKTPEQKAEMRTKKLTEELSLNDDQQKKIKALLLQRELEKVELKKQQEARRAKMKADMKAILTAEQFEKWEEKKEDHHKGGKK